MKIRILIADDHTIMRQGLEAVLASEPEIEIVGHAVDGLCAVKLVAELKPELVIMDIDMPGLSGIGATRQIASMHMRTRILALTRSACRDVILEMLEAGAKGYVVKTSPFDELLEGIQAVTAGRVFLCSQAVRSVCGAGVNNLHMLRRTGRFSLSARERQILKYIANGYTIKDIAKLLARSTKTVVTTRGILMRKLGVNSTPGLVKYAMRKGLTS